MRRLLEWLLGLDRGFLNRPGNWSITFDPRWPFQSLVSPFTWTVLSLAACGALVWWTYLRKPEHRRRNWPMAALRFCVFVLATALLNRPQFSVAEARVEPSVLAIAVDDSLSMRVADADAAGKTSRLDAVVERLSRENGALLDKLRSIHDLRFFRFGGDASELPGDAAAALRELKPEGAATDLDRSLDTIAGELRGARVAGVVMLTDGRDTSGERKQAAAGGAALPPVFAVPVGSDERPRNLAIERVEAQDNVFVGDVVNIKVGVRTTGVPAGTDVHVVLKKADGSPMLAGGKPTESVVRADADGVLDTELQFVPTAVGTQDLLVEATPIGGEVDDADNSRVIQIGVLDSHLTVLLIDGAPRWEYRYLRQELTRDTTIDVSCLLTSADSGFTQDGNRPISRFPETLEEMLAFDVLVIGDVDPRQFTDAQLALINEFVSLRGGGLCMIAGTRFAPRAYEGTPVEPILPVDISRVERGGGATENIAEGFRLALTSAGRDASQFRFLLDPQANQAFLAGQIQKLFWYCRGVTAKSGVGETLATHPKETGPDGRLAPLIVTGRFGTGRTMFSAVDETWRWRYYTGEDVFHGFWTQSLRYLARGKKLGQRKLTLSTDRPLYTLGETGRVTARVLDPQVGARLGEELSMQLVDAAGQPFRTITLGREGSDAYSGGFTADRIGRFGAKLPAGSAADVPELQTPFEVSVPRVELVDPSVDRASLGRLAARTNGAVVAFDQIESLVQKIPSARREFPVFSTSPLWAAPLALLLFVAAITAEWVMRKRAGLV